MKMDWLKPLGIGAFALSLFAAAPASAEMFDDWDTDDEVGISEDEWGTGFGESGVYDTWDADDGLLSEDEFNSGVFGSYDANDDGTIDETEFGVYEDDVGDKGFWDV